MNQIQNGLFTENIFKEKFYPVVNSYVILMYISKAVTQGKTYFAVKTISCFYLNVKVTNVNFR